VSVISRKTSTTFLFLLSFYAFILLPLTPLWAQPFELSEDTDIFAPLIRHQPLEEALQSGGAYKIEARVSDNIGVSEVILYYRTYGNEPYSSINMESIWQGDYSAVIPKEDIAEPGLEYYIQASDLNGNTSQHAFPFSPLRIEVVVASKDGIEEEIVTEPIPTEREDTILANEILPVEREPFALSTEKPLAPQTIPEKKPWYKKWWVWTIALAVVGGVAAGSGGGGGGGAGAPTTGSIDVSGPVP